MSRIRRTPISESGDRSISLRRLPALPMLMAAVTGILLGLFFDIPTKYLVTVWVGFPVLGLVLLRLRVHHRVVVITVLMAITAGSAHRTTEHLARPVRRQVQEFARSGKEVMATGRVVLGPQGGWNRHYITLDRARLFRGEDSVLCGPLRVRLFSDSMALAALEHGDGVCATGSLRSASVRGMRSRASFVATLTQREAADIAADSFEIARVPAEGFGVGRYTDRVRRAIERTFDHRIGPDGAAICKALALGDRSAFSPQFSDALRLSGLSHIFALSGMNVGFLVLLIAAALRLTFLPHVARWWILLIALLFYMELGREAPSLVRAVLMCVVYVLGRILLRRTDILNLLCVAALLELLWRPLDILDAGFQLSYLAVLGLIGGYVFLKDLLLTKRDWLSRRWGVAVANVLAATFATQIATLPVSAFLFQQAPFLGVLGNLMAIPGYALLLFWSVLLLAVSSLPPVAETVGRAVDLVAFAMGKIVTFSASTPLSSLDLHGFQPLSKAVAIATFVGLMIAMLSRRRRAILVVAILIAGLVVWQPLIASRTPERVMFVDVGNGDAVFVQSANGRNVLIDAGPSFAGWTAAEVILPALTEAGVRRIDALILTHPDADHIGGGAELIRRDAVSRVFGNGDSASSWVYADLMATAASRRIRIEVLRAGDELHLSESTMLRVVWPDSVNSMAEMTDNQRSLVLRLESRQASALFMADVDTLIEDLLIRSGLVEPAQLLKLGHHGSKSSSAMAFLRQVHPEVAVISSGRNNIYGHPHSSVVDRLDSLRIAIHGTAVEGTLDFVLTEKGWRLRVPAARRLASLWKLPYA